jgi:membrane protein
MKQVVRIFQVLLFRFKKDLCLLRASALSFSTILSLVPLLAVMFGIAKGFGIDRILEKALQNEFKDQEEVIQYLIHFGNTLLEQTRGGVVAGIGIITLFYTVLRLLSTIENSLNAMWGHKESRPISRKIIDFLSLILICPIFLVISSSLTVFVVGHIETLKDSDSILANIQPLMSGVLSFLPYIVSMLLFTFLYMFLPNAKVRLSSALIAGLIAGAAYQLLQASYIAIQIKVSRTGAIYGSFAALPLFMMWLYVSWLIFLTGAEILVLHQEKLWNSDIVAPYRSLSRFEKKLTYLAITKIALDNFMQAKPPITTEEIADELKLPVRLATELIEELLEVKILLKTISGILPARPPEQLRFFDVLTAIDGENTLFQKANLVNLKTFEAHLKKGREIVANSDINESLVKL